MGMLDVFKADGFSTASLTDTINKVDFQPGRIGKLGIFQERGILTTVVQVEEKAGQLALIQTTPRGAPAAALGAVKRKLRTFAANHLAEEATILADEVLNVRAYGSEIQLQTIQDLVTDRMTDLRARHEVTLEFHRIRAIQGEVLDADGSSLLDLFTAFDVIQQTSDFNLDSGSTDVRQVCVDTLRKIEDELGGTPYTQARGLCSAGFFDALVGHELVKQAFLYQQGQVLGQDLRTAGFTFGGIIWEEYRGSVSGQDFIDDDKAYVFPQGAGASSIFRTYFAPADFIDPSDGLPATGLPIYAKQAIDPEFQRWVKIHTQQNPLNLCLRPRAVIECSKT